MGSLNPEDCGQASRWTPETDEEEMMFVLPLPAADYRYLWHTWRGTYSSSLSFVPGDVWLYVDWDSTQRLYFIGPETTKHEVVIHADHPMTNFALLQDPPARADPYIISTRETPVAIHLYQPGAGRRKPLGTSAWDIVSRDDP
jgi:hypothetical protein